VSEEQQRRARRAATGVRTAALWAAVKDLVTERAAALGRPLRVLDLGGGTGELAVPLAELGPDLVADVTVVDPSPDALAALGRRAAESGVQARVHGSQGDADTLAELDRFDLLLIEQPLQEDDIVDHATLAKQLRTPVCLDESIVSEKAARDALALGSASVINIKAGRVGGHLEGVAIHDLCREAGVPVWCGGMLETGIGRAANAALAALPGFTLPGDVSASDRFYVRDIVTEPIVLEDGHVRVPTGHGLGVEIDPVALDDVTVDRVELRR